MGLKCGKTSVHAGYISPAKVRLHVVGAEYIAAMTRSALISFDIIARVSTVRLATGFWADHSWTRGRW